MPICNWERNFVLSLYMVGSLKESRNGKPSQQVPQELHFSISYLFLNPLFKYPRLGENRNWNMNDQGAITSCAASCQLPSTIAISCFTYELIDYTKSVHMPAHKLWQGPLIYPWDFSGGANTVTALIVIYLSVTAILLEHLIDMDEPYIWIPYLINFGLNLGWS